MRRIPALVAAAFALTVVLATPAMAQDRNVDDVVDVEDLLSNAPAFVGEVTVEGELIGDFGFRNDGSMWTQLNDDSYVYDPILDDGELTGGNVGVAVRIPQAIAELLDPPGGYRVRGPVVSVTGVWKYHDPDRGGESYIDVADLRVVIPGAALVEHPNLGILAAGVLLIFGALYLRRSTLQAHN